MMLNALAQLLVDARLGALGKTLFIHHMPATCSQGVVLRLPLSGIDNDQYTPGFYKTQFQAIVRDKSHAAGQALADKIVDALNIYDRDFAAHKVRVVQSYCCTLPVVYPRLPDNLLEWSIMFDIQYLDLYN